MLPAAYRLKNKKDFERVAQKGRRFFSTFFIARISPTPLDHPKVGVIISGKVAKQAVVRNRLKRWIMNDVQTQIDMLCPTEYVLIPKKHIVNESHSALTADLTVLLRKIHEEWNT